MKDRDLTELLKGKLDIVELVRERVELKLAGRNWKGLCPFHNEKTPSFNVRQETGTFHCFGCGAHGDQLNWLAFMRFNIRPPVGQEKSSIPPEDFVQILKDGCKRAGEDFEAYCKKDPRALEAAKQKRKTESILEIYLQAAEAAWTKHAYERITNPKPDGIGKAWLKPEVIKRWRLGYAPNLEQLKAAGLTEDSLRSVGLLRKSQQEDGGEYLHFRDSIIFPFIQRGRVVCLRDRTLGSRDAKYMGMPSAQGAGVPQPDGYNLEALYGIWPGHEDAEAAPSEIYLVEGPLDAIALCEQGHAAVAILTSGIAPGLAKRVRRLDGATIYTMLDGTKDVTGLKRCELADKIGPRTLVCILPAGLDPDELIPEDIASTKQEARTCLDEWLAVVEHTFPDQKDAILKKFARVLVEWDSFFTGTAGDRKAAVCAALNMDAAQYKTWLEKDGGVRPQPVEGGWQPDDYFPRQPMPPGKAPAGEEKRKVITNHEYKKDPQAEAEAGSDDEPKKKVINLNIDNVRAQIQASLNGFPFRWGAAGQKHPVLFVPDMKGSIRPFHGSKALETVCMEYATVKFREKVDAKGTTPVKWDNLFQHFAGSVEIQEYESIAYRPHEPLIDGIFYAYRPDPDYPSPDGRYLLEALDLFPNIKEPWMKYIFLAMIATPYWGGPKAARPIGCYTADAPGRGKGRASELVGLPAGGMIEIEAGKRGEEQFKERLLSGDSFHKWVIRLDNLKRGLTSPLIESVVTLPDVSGKGMYKGESSRPNYFTMLVTANNPRVSSDIARRSVFIHLDKPVETVAWNRRYEELIVQSRRIVADCIWLLRQERPQFEIDGTGETFGTWFAEVVGAVISNPLFRSAIGELDFKQLIAANMARRKELDQDHDQAQRFEDHLVRFVAGRRGFCKLGREPDGSSWKETREIRPPAQAVKIPAEEITDAWNDCFGGDTKSAWVGRFVNGHFNAGRFRWLRPAARASSNNQYELPADAFTGFLAAFEKGDEGLPDVGYQDRPASKPQEKHSAREGEIDFTNEQ